MQKRILREINNTFPENVKKYAEDYTISVNESDGLVYWINSLTISSKQYDCKLVVKLNDNYPFKPPKISFHNSSISYSYWCSQILNKKDNYSIFISYVFTCIFMKSLQGITKIPPDNQTCLCCQSYHCGYRWSPSINLFMVFNECVYRKNLLKFLKPIYKVYFIKLFKNDRWNIPDDLIMHIIEFL